MEGNSDRVFGDTDSGGVDDALRTPQGESARTTKQNGMHPVELVRPAFEELETAAEVTAYMGHW